MFASQTFKNMERAKLVDYFLAKIHDKDFEIYQVRQELEKHNIDEDEIKVIVRIVDNAHQRLSLTKAGNSKANELIWIGLVITIVSAGVTIGTYLGIINMGNSFLIAYGPFFGGLGILFTGLAKKKRG